MASSLPLCRYGAKCYRKNPEHLQQFSHPPKLRALQKPDDEHKRPDMTSGSCDKPTDSADEPLPACKFGVKCYRRSMKHFSKFSHPIKSGESVADDGNDDMDDDSRDDGVSYVFIIDTTFWSKTIFAHIFCVFHFPQRS